MNCIPKDRYIACEVAGIGSGVDSLVNPKATILGHFDLILWSYVCVQSMYTNGVCYVDEYVTNVGHFESASCIIDTLKE